MHDEGFIPLATHDGFVLRAGTRFDDDEAGFSVCGEDAWTMISMMVGWRSPMVRTYYVYLGLSSLFRRHPCHSTAISSSQRRRPPLTKFSVA